MTPQHHKMAATLSGLVYEPWATVSSELVRLNLEMIDVFDDRAMQVLVVEDRLPPEPARRFVVFRGTEFTKFNLDDIDANMRANFVRWGGPGRIHLGYYLYAMRAWNFVRANSNYWPTYFTGHSMGGVLAVINGAQMNQSKDAPHLPEEIITFGSPRAGDQVFIDATVKPHYRYVNGIDFAANFPPGGFHHDVGPIRLESEHPRDIIKDHSIERYIQVIHGQET